jgi:hypothetical protein
MPCALDFSETAAEDLDRLFESVPASRHQGAIDAIEVRCRALAENPPERSFGTFPLHFQVDGVHYYWAGTYRVSLDRRRLSITHVFRAPAL